MSGDSVALLFTDIEGSTLLLDRLGCAGWMAWNQGDPEAAEPLLHEALSLLKGEDDELGRAADGFAIPPQSVIGYERRWCDLRPAVRLRIM